MLSVTHGDSIILYIKCDEKLYWICKENICKMASNKDLEFDFEMLLMDLEKGRKKGKKTHLFFLSCLTSQGHCVFIL